MKIETPTEREAAKQLICTAPVAKGIMDGNKTQTRRLIKRDDHSLVYSNLQGMEKLCALFDNKDNSKKYKHECVSVRYKAGDILWVREPASVHYCNGDYGKIGFTYLSDGNQDVIGIPGRFRKQTKDGFLPNWMRRKKGVPNGCIKEMARTFVTVAGVKVERLNKITYEDIIAEGYIPRIYDEATNYHNAFSWWIKLWNSLAEDGYKWEDNPYVVVYEIRKI